MDLHRKTREMLNRYVMITNLGIKKLQVINYKLRNHLKNAKLANRTRKMRVEKMEQWMMDLGYNPKYEAYVQDLIKTKDKKI
jgi:hypothetical protein